MLKLIPIGSIEISAITKAEFLAEVKQRLISKQKTWVTTPYSEFLYAALRSGEARDLLAEADIAIADGVGILWAERFLARPLTVRNHLGKILQAWWQVVVTGARILLTPSYLYQRIPEKITGASVFVEMVRVAWENDKSIYLLGNWDDSAKKTAFLLQEQFTGLKVAGFSNKTGDDPSVFADIKQAQPDILFVGFGPIKQERWIHKYLADLPVTIAIGVGGTFDYFSGNQLRPPMLIRDIGLEWLFRLITQPLRAPRIYRATFGLVLSLVRYKVFASYPLRANAVAVAVNSENKILLCKRIVTKDVQGRSYKDNYWQFPQGGLDAGEEIVPGAARELQEETGISSVEPLGVAGFKHSYEWLNGARSVLFNRRVYKGQEQQTVFFRFTGSDDEVKVDGREFSDFAWLEPSEVLTRIAPERRRHAAAVLEELREILQ
jgi:N-acetylglucosaminyldiphosphoundecaprenol N-acetyl-beta-D-mannosaminyltransferase